MKLLFDHNLSQKLVASLSDIFPNADHVFLLGLHLKDDIAIWEYALSYEFTIVTKDADFSDLTTLLGFPPKIIWIRRGNCRTDEIAKLLRNRQDAISDFENDSDLGSITLF